LSGEISQNVGPVASPEWNDTFFSSTSLEAVDDAWIELKLPV
jgi:hypothetical protein